VPPNIEKDFWQTYLDLQSATPSSDDNELTFKVQILYNAYAYASMAKDFFLETSVQDQPLYVDKILDELMEALLKKIKEFLSEAIKNAEFQYGKETIGFFHGRNIETDFWKTYTDLITRQRNSGLQTQTVYLQNATLHDLDTALYNLRRAYANVKKAKNLSVQLFKDREDFRELNFLFLDVLGTAITDEVNAYEKQIESKSSQNLGLKITALSPEESFSKKNATIQNPPKRPPFWKVAKDTGINYELNIQDIPNRINALKLAKYDALYTKHALDRKSQDADTKIDYIYAIIYYIDKAIQRLQNIYAKNGKYINIVDDDKTSPDGQVLSNLIASIKKLPEHSSNETYETIWKNYLTWTKIQDSDLTQEHEESMKNFHIQRIENTIEDAKKAESDLKNLFGVSEYFETYQCAMKSLIEALRMQRERYAKAFNNTTGDLGNFIEDVDHKGAVDDGNQVDDID
jgi:hypothetical protein